MEIASQTATQAYVICTIWEKEQPSAARPVLNWERNVSTKVKDTPKDLQQATKTTTLFVWSAFLFIEDLTWVLMFYCIY